MCYGENGTGCTVIIRQENERHARLTKREPDRERQSRAYKIISEQVVMPLAAARMSHDVRRIFHVLLTGLYRPRR